MIIWSGLGILVFVSLISGFILSLVLTPILESLIGPSASNFGFALTILAASVMNWGFSFFLKKKGSQVLVDPKTGSTYQLQRNDSFFFIPIGAFTYIFVIIGTILMIPAFLSEPVPEFSDEDLERRATILTKTSNDGGSNHGNTPESKMAAALFQRLITNYNKQAFESREIKIRGNTANFTTYCLQREKLALFITDIDDYNAYRDSKVKNLLSDLLWRSGQEAARRIGIKDNEKLIVVLRKGKTDKMILSGLLSYQPSRNTGFVESNRLVYLFDEQATIFEAEPQTNPEPTKTRVKENETIAKTSEQHNAVKKDNSKSGSPAAGEQSDPQKSDSTVISSDEFTEEELKAEFSRERMWKDTEGRQFSGTFIHTKEADLYFLQKGNTFHVPLITLSKWDKKLVNSYVKLFPSKKIGVAEVPITPPADQALSQKKIPKEMASQAKESQPPASTTDKVNPLSKERTWIDANGREMVAKFLKLEEDNVVFEKKGATYRFPLAQLSPPDQKLIQENTP